MYKKERSKLIHYLSRIFKIFANVIIRIISVHLLYLLDMFDQAISPSEYFPFNTTIIIIDIFIWIRSGGSKSLFSSLLLANFEQQMQFDPTANFSSNLAFEICQDNTREKICENYRQKMKKKAEIREENTIIKIKDDNDDNDEISSEDDESCENEPKTGIRLNVDPFVCQNTFYFIF